MPKSGIKGFLWKENRSSGSWVVVLNGTKELEPRIVSKKGTPTRRLEQSTGTDSLVLARKRFPRIMSGLQQPLEEASGLFRETADERLKRSIASQYLTALEKPERVQQLGGFIEQALLRDSQQLAARGFSPDQVHLYEAAVQNTVNRCSKAWPLIKPTQQGWSWMPTK